MHAAVAAVAPGAAPPKPTVGMSGGAGGRSLAEVGIYAVAIRPGHGGPWGGVPGQRRGARA
eukprot:28577-Prymnesium_polylepis.1